MGLIYSAVLKFKSARDLIEQAYKYLPEDHRWSWPRQLSARRGAHRGY
jgi:hypothetical protein